MNCGQQFGQIVIRAATKAPALFGFVQAAPLLEEERNARFLTLPQNRQDPLLLHRPCTGSALAADDHPIDATQV
jgi:hypothetical protein